MEAGQSMVYGSNRMGCSIVGLLQPIHLPPHLPHSLLVLLMRLPLGCCVSAVCTAAEHCPPMTLPDGTQLPASACTKDSIWPTDDEKLTGGEGSSLTHGAKHAWQRWYTCKMQLATGIS